MAQDAVDTPSDDRPVPPVSPPPTASEGTFGSHWWFPYVLPFVVYMLVGILEPTPPKPPILGPNGESWELPHQETLQDALGIEYKDYPTIYTIKIGLTVLTMLIMLPAYLKFPLRVSWLAVVVGVVGVVLWIAICWLHLERFLPAVGLGWLVNLGERPAYDPLKQLADQPGWAYGFLAIRFFGLVVVVPIIEEFFLRGWLMRYIMHPDWWKIPFGKVNGLAVIAGTAVPMLMHPGELVAAAVWFSMVTWLMVRTKNIWDCVVAHAVTNLLLGIFVVTFGWWWLW
jgi:CAAX prenyl protease-like protein